jgi:hypothetical protein
VSAPVIVCDPFSTIVELEIDQQLEQRINIKFLVKLGKEWSQHLSDVAAGLCGSCLKMKHCFQVGTALLGRSKRSHGQQKVRAPFHFVQ